MTKMTMAARADSVMPMMLSTMNTASTATVTGSTGTLTREST